MLKLLLCLAANNWRRDFLVEYWGEHYKDIRECPSKSNQDLAVSKNRKSFRQSVILLLLLFWAFHFQPFFALQECNTITDCVCDDAKNNTYSCVRWLDDHHNYMYCQFQDNEVSDECRSRQASEAHPQLCTDGWQSSTKFFPNFAFSLKGFEEAYDLNADPYQLNNIAAHLETDLKLYLHARLHHLQRCSGVLCREEIDYFWRTLVDKSQTHKSDTNLDSVVTFSMSLVWPCLYVFCIFFFCRNFCIAWKKSWYIDLSDADVWFQCRILIKRTRP